METITPSRPQLIQVVNQLPQEALSELASFLSYLQFKTENLPTQNNNGSDFLMSITALGEADETLAERDEEILIEEIDSVRGWSFNRDNKL